MANATRNPAAKTPTGTTRSHTTIRMAPMWRKVRRAVLALVLSVVLVGLVLSTAYNALTRPRGLSPRDAAVPGSFAEVNGSLTHYEVAGSGSVPVVLLHGRGAWSFTWRPTLTALGADGRFSAYAPDLRGFGFTERPPDGLYNAEGYAAHVEEFIDALGLERPILVGNSLGGEVALRVALARPDRVRGVVLVDAPVLAGDPTLSRAVARLMVVPPFHRTYIRLYHSNRLPFGGLEDSLRRLYFDPGSVNLEEVEANVRRPLDQKGAEDSLIAMWRTHEDPVPEERIRQLGVPVFIVWGENDAVAPLEQGRRLHAAIPGSRLAVYPRTGHVPQEERRERFAADLIGFAGELVEG